MEIRPVMLEDAEAIASIRRQNGVREGVLALSSERINTTVDFLNSLTGRDRGYVAVENGEVVGFSGLQGAGRTELAMSIMATPGLVQAVRGCFFCENKLSSHSVKNITEDMWQEAVALLDGRDA